MMDTLAGRAAARAEALAEETIALTRALVRANTVNPYSGDPTRGNEGNGQAIIEPILRDLGARIERFDCPPDVYAQAGVLGPKGREFAGRPNVQADLRFGGGGPRALLQAHMDTVGTSDMTIDPFSAEVRDGRIRGRGASDCKGGIAATLTALRVLREFAGSLRGSVLFQSVVDEECNGGGAGAMACCLRGLQADFGIVTDGFGPLITRGYSGVLTVELRVPGVSGHAAWPLGVSAIEKALVVKEALDQFKRDREGSRRFAQVNLGIFRAGIHPAIIPGEALLALNLSYPMEDARAARAAGAGFGGGPIRAEFEQRIRAREAADPFLAAHPSAITWVKDLIPFETPAEHPLVTGLAETHRRILGRDPEVTVSGAWSDASYLPRLCGIPTVVYGAGTPGKAHSHDEYAEVSRIVDTSKVLAAYLCERLGA
ncbi:MAG: M20/M25/M40 family metallo-hydrolase [Armatimonadetes bacterium]|nr:M20/M25/M40 family metallo-hydrolase [Armatimonadota bacterium]